MCLTRIAPEAPENPPRIGYKWFRRFRDTLESPIMSSGPWKIGEWKELKERKLTPIQRRNNYLPAEQGGWYSPGFHVLENFQDALAWGRAMFFSDTYVLVECEIEDIHTYGEEVVSLGIPATFRRIKVMVCRRVKPKFILSRRRFTRPRY